MVTLDEYKNYLLNNYRYKIDSLPEKARERERLLSKYYPDEFLNKIINDTYEFAIDIFNSETLKYGYCHFEIDDDTTFGIDLNITGGGYSDKLYKDSNERIISEHILETIFGKSFYINVECDEIERECEEDVLSFDYHYYLYMQGFPKNLDEIKDKLFSEIKYSDLRLIKRLNR